MNFHRKAKEVLYVTMRKGRELPVSTLWICTDEINGDNRAGRAYCRLFPESICFRDLGELLVRADIMFDRAGYPQAYQESGSFVSDNIRGAVYTPELYFTNKELQDKQGKISTEYIIVKSRRRSGWQGTYIDNHEKQSDFISEIELLKKISRHTTRKQY